MPELTAAEVAKHTAENDCWVIVNGQVLDVTEFLGDHPGGKLAIMTFAGKDATEEFNMVHPPGVVEKYLDPASVLGPVGAGGGGGAIEPVPGSDDEDESEDESEGGDAGGITKEEVAKHVAENDCWVIVNNQVLDVTSFLGDHPGGKLAIMTFAGKDATEEFNMVHPPGVVEKYLDPAFVLGAVGAGGAAKPKKEKKKKKAAAGGVANDLQKPLLVHPAMESIEEAGLIASVWALFIAFMREIFGTIFFTGNFGIKGDRKGLTRSAFFLIMFMVIHAVGNLHIFLGPDDFCGYGYFYVRLYWTGFGFEANIVEEYVALCALLHVIVALKRTYDITWSYPVNSGKWNLAFSGVWLFVFMSIHLQQFRFGATQPYKIRPPPYLIDFNGINPFGGHFLNLFWTEDTSIEKVAVRDIYKLEFDVFKSTTNVIFYELSVVVFLAHYIWGWLKVVPSSQLDIPKNHHGRVNIIGIAIGVFVALCYFSFPIYCVMVDPSPGTFGHI